MSGPNGPSDVDPLEIEKAAKVVDLARDELTIGRTLAAAPDAEVRAAEARELAGTPVGFAKMVLGLDQYWWQATVLSWFENTKKLVKGSLCTPNGAGKSACVDAPLALWWITVHPQGMVVITTKDSKQLDNQLWPAIERHKQKFPQYDFIERMVRNGRGGFIIGFTTDDPGRAEGWHKLNDFSGPLLIIEDEAKSIADSIDMALDRCTYNAKLATSSPGLTEGWFYKTHANQALGYQSLKVGLKECPHIPKSRIDNIIATYGPDHWFTRSTLHAEFTDADSDVLKVIPKQIVLSAMENPPPYVPGGQRAFLDFGAGRAENVFMHRRGNRVSCTAWKDPDPMRAIGQFIALFIREGLLPSEIKADAGGIGIPILARFNELGWPIIGVNGEEKPKNFGRYPNKRAEVYHEAPNRIQGLILPNDPVLLEQLCGMRAMPASGGKLGLETKQEMQARGFPSPDRADALVGVLDDDISGASTLFDGEGLKKLEHLARAANRPERGVVELAEQGVDYKRTPDGWLTVHEKPIGGFSYLCVLSPVRHDDLLGNHVLIVLRDSYRQEEDERPARVVAKVNLRPFRYDVGPLVEVTKKVSWYYGKCLVVPIVNDRGDVIERLLSEGLPVWARENFEVSKSGRAIEAIRFGWENNDFNRSMWIGTLAEAIRKDMVVTEDVPTVMELYQLTGGQMNLREAEALGVGVQLLKYSSSFVRRDNSFKTQLLEESNVSEESMYS